MMLFYFLGCSNLDDSPSVQESVHQYTLDSNTEIDSEFDLETMESAVNDAFGQLLKRHASPIVASYQDVIDYSDSYCPQAYDIDGNSFWYGNCTSTQGMSYDGYLFYNTYTDWDLFLDGGSWEVITLSAASDMIYPSNDSIHWGGNATIAHGTNPDGYPVFFSSIQGSFLDETSSEEWLNIGSIDSITLFGVYFDFGTSQSNGMYVNGSTSINGGSGITAIEYNELLVYSFPGFPCDKEFIGTLALRDEQGRWIDIEFDIEEDWTMSGSCDGCGTALYNNEEIGEFCVDANLLLDWDGSPWPL
jgi:hypothetical protein